MNAQSINRLNVSQIKRKNFTNISKKQFKAKYGYLQEINRGAQGLVKKGHDGERPVAIKIYFKQSVRSDLIKYVVSEISILNEFNHPNILGFFQSYRIQGSTQHDDQFCVVTELCQGNLQNYEQIKQLKFSQKVRILKQISSGLAYAHQKGIAHRDLKPQNVLVMNLKEFKGIKIADFGCSKKLEGNLLTSSVGTPLYSDPNIYTKDYTQKCDIFSLGQLAQYLFCGRNIFSHCQDFRDVTKAKQKLFGNFQKQIKRFIKDQQKDGLISRNQSNFLQLVMCYTLSQNEQKRLSATQLEQIFSKTEQKFKEEQHKTSTAIQKSEVKKEDHALKFEQQSKPKMKITQSIFIQKQRNKEAAQIKRYARDLEFTEVDIINKIQQQELEEAIRLSRQSSNLNSNSSNISFQSHKDYYPTDSSQRNFRNSQFLDSSQSDTYAYMQESFQESNLSQIESNKKINEEGVEQQSIFHTIVHQNHYQITQQVCIESKLIAESNQNINDTNYKQEITPSLKKKVKTGKNNAVILQMNSQEKQDLTFSECIQSNSQDTQQVQKSQNSEQNWNKDSDQKIDDKYKPSTVSSTDVKKSMKSIMNSDSFSKNKHKNKRHSIQIFSQKRSNISISNSVKEIKKQQKEKEPLNSDKHLSYQQIVYVKYLKACRKMKERQQVISKYQRILQGLKRQKQKWKVIRKIEEISSYTLKNQQKQCVVFLFNTIYIYILEDYERLIFEKDSNISKQFNINSSAFTPNQIDQLSNFIDSQKMRVSAYTFKLAESLHKSAMYIQPKLSQFFHTVVEEIRKSRNQLSASQVEIVAQKFYLKDLKIQFEILIDSIKKGCQIQRLTQSQCQNIIRNLQTIKETVLFNH